MSWAALCIAEALTKPAAYRITAPNSKALTSCSGLEIVVEIAEVRWIETMEAWFAMSILLLVLN